MDATALAVFRQAPELYRLRFGHHLAPPSDVKRDAGSALHLALDAWFQQPTSDARAPMAALRAAMQSEWDVQGLAPAQQARGQPHMERVLEGYMRVHPREKDFFRVTHNEAYLEARIESAEGAFDWCAIVDRKIALPDASAYVMDTKSTGAYVNDAFIKRMSLSDQLIGNVALERALGRRCDGFYLDAVHVDDKYQHVKDEHFRRVGPVLVPAWRVEKWAADVRWTLDEIDRLLQKRGLDKPWPVYHNWLYGKPDPAFWPFIEQPAELHAQLRAAYEVREWVPKQVAEDRKVLRAAARLAE